MQGFDPLVVSQTAPLTGTTWRRAAASYTESLTVVAGVGLGGEAPQRVEVPPVELSHSDPPSPEVVREAVVG